jgi:hypothetical protein
MCLPSVYQNTHREASNLGVMSRPLVNAASIAVVTSLPVNSCSLPSSSSTPTHPQSGVLLFRSRPAMVPH